MFTQKEYKLTLRLNVLKNHKEVDTYIHELFDSIKSKDIPFVGSSGAILMDYEIEPVIKTKEIELKTVANSSQIGFQGYDLKDKTLAIQFSSGQLYYYYDVPEDEYNRFLEADSKGSYLFKNIKRNYLYEHIKK